MILILSKNLMMGQIFLVFLKVLLQQNSSQENSGTLSYDEDDY